MEKPYQNREIDEKFKEVHKRFDGQDITLAEIKSMVSYTNGKVKKIIIALAMIAGVILGNGGKDLAATLIKLFI